MNKGHGNRNFVLILAAILVFFVAIIIAAIVDSHTPKNTAESAQNAKHINIENFKSATPNIPEFYKIETENSLWQVLHNYNEITDDTYTTAEIRTGTYQEEARESVTYSEFIVDLPELEHSFKVSFNWTRSNNPYEYDISIECPSLDQIIYKDTTCLTSYDPINTLAPFLPTEIDKNATLSIQYYGSLHPTRANKAYLSIDAYTCDKNARKNLEKKVTAWLNEYNQDSLYFYIEYFINCPRKSHENK